MVIYKNRKDKLKIPSLSKEEIKNIECSVLKGLNELDKKLKTGGKKK